MNNLHEKTIAASERFLERRGYEVLSTNQEAPDGFGTIDVVAMDEDTIVFVTVEIRKATDGFPEEDNDRVKDATVVTAKWLAENAERRDVAEMPGMLRVGYRPLLALAALTKLSNIV